MFQYLKGLMHDHKISILNLNVSIIHISKALLLLQI
ncbi:hypothetical protein WH7805_08401 [Synechococcus sp. WH 7805]|nr:hypothetical protein WH7805_08401 [Synechococcus sp. WH 7805]